MSDQITDTPPATVQRDLDALKLALDAQLPPLKTDNLVIGTWNITAFGDLSKSWRDMPGATPKRNFHAIACIADILRRFDVIAVQEVRGNIRALRYTLKLLGPDWSFLMTDVTEGSKGNDERLAFLFNLARVKPSGLAAEIVIPEDDREELSIPTNSFQRQFVRTPYAVSFLRGDKTFILVTLHINYGKSADDRIGELTSIARWMKNWARRTESFGQNLIALGDFNIDRTGDKLYEAFTSTGLSIPPELATGARTIFSTPGKPELDKHYDHIAWFEKASGLPYLTLQKRAAGIVTFIGHVMTDLDKQAISWRMSDHVPLWVEFEC